MYFPAVHTKAETHCMFDLHKYIYRGKYFVSKYATSTHVKNKYSCYSNDVQQAKNISKQVKFVSTWNSIVSKQATSTPASSVIQFTLAGGL